MKPFYILLSFAIVLLALNACSAVPSTPPDSVTLLIVNNSGQPIADAEVGRGGPHGEDYYTRIGRTDNWGFVLFKSPVM